MKAEYNGSDRHNNFSNLHHPFSHHNFHLSSDHRHQPSDDDVTTTPAAAPFISKHIDGATVEVPRRKRGRPPGSKNKPKKLKPGGDVRASAGEPEPASDMSPYILEVAAGNDVVEAVSSFCRRKGTGLCILSASGTVANFTLRQPRPGRNSTSPPPSVTFHGRFDILSISATFLHYTQSNQIPSGFSIFLAGPQGQVVGGTVAGPLVTAGPVFIVAALLNNPSRQKLPDDEDENEEECNWKSAASESQSLESGGGVDSGNTPPQPQPVIRPMYSCHMGSDVVWAPPSGSSRHY